LAEPSHGDGGIAGHLHYWTLKIDESNPFMQIHIDTMVVSLVVAGAMFAFALWLKGRLVEGAPVGAQNFMESVVGFVNDTVKDNFPVHNPLIAPLAFTIFVFIALVNSIDVLPAFLLAHVLKLHLLYVAGGMFVAQMALFLSALLEIRKKGEDVG